jgi:hypothetical protein
MVTAAILPPLFSRLTFINSAGKMIAKSAAQGQN